nr:caspase recruitment domain-containing protein 8-like isoform X7 [Chrysemys picta bellii]
MRVPRLRDSTASPPEASVVFFPSPLHSRAEACSRAVPVAAAAAAVAPACASRSRPLLPGPGHDDQRPGVSGCAGQVPACKGEMDEPCSRLPRVERRAGGSGDDVSSLKAKVESYGTREDDSAQECKSGDDSSENNSESSSESESDTEETDIRKSDEALEKNELLPPVESEAHSQFRCEHVKTEHNQKEQVTPRKLSRGQFWLKLEAEGTYQCTVTGLIFDVTKAAVIKYSVLSWSKYADYVKKPWIVGGPIFDVSCDTASVLTSIQFPHSLSLNDHESDMTFKVLHIKSTGPAIEPSVDHSMTHVKWHVSSLSPVGPVIQTQEPVHYNGAVILYKVVNNHPSLSFRVYVATNNDSFIKDISNAVKHSDKKFIKIDKPPVCKKQLQDGKRYRLISESEAEITPEEIEFVDGSLLKLKSYFEVYLEQPMEFTLSLIELESEEIVWKAKLRECDWILHDQNKNERKRNAISNRRRKSSNSLSDEEFYNKRLKGRDISVFEFCPGKGYIFCFQYLFLYGQLIQRK